MPRAVDITLLVCTYNRANDLRELLDSAVAQATDGTVTYEVLVVDNNSSDNTRAVVDGYIAAGHTQVRYLFEGKQGKSNALNSGLASMQGSIFAITDDDFVLPPDWVMKILNGFVAHPDASFVSGRVLPLWQSDVPDWLTSDHWAAIALTDYGDQTFFADARRPVCLLACAFRKDHVQSVGGYRSDLGVSADAIGGVEDFEILQRLWKSGKRGIYLPEMYFHHKVQAHRMTKAYHRRWHSGHGRFYATLRDPDFERSKGTLFGVPLHMYRQAATSLWRFGQAALFGTDPAVVLTHENSLRFFGGFWRERTRDKPLMSTLLEELVAAARSMVRRSGQ